jgi:hypothetical protein
MFILARGGQSYARLRFNVGPGNEVLIPVEVDYTRPFSGSDIELWHKDYLANVRVPPPAPPKAEANEGSLLPAFDERRVEDWWNDAWDDYAEFRAQEEAEYGYIRDF